MITGLAHVCFTTGDLPRSLAFYQGVLGFKPSFDFTNERDEKFGAYLHVSGRTFVEVFEGRLEPRAAGQSYGHVCLEVNDIQATVADLRARGAEVSDPVLGSDQSWQAWLSDPDRNRIELHAYTPRSWQAPHLE